MRIIPCLDLKDGRVVKGVKFVNLKDAGCPVAIARAYNDGGADELVFLDITATVEGRKTVLDVIARAAEAVTIPLAVGGGIRELADFKAVMGAGASKAGVNTAAFYNPKLIADAADKFGSGAVVAAIDAHVSAKGGFSVLINGGKTDTGKDAIVWAREVERLGAGEILLTSMDRDGTKSGYDLKLTRAVADAVSIPVIASGGAGRLEHFYEALTEGGADAVLAASLFHFKEIDIQQLRSYLNDRLQKK